MSLPLEGLLLLDKPTGPTSHDVVARVRALTGQRRAGHAGTLDPLASGLLPIVLGRATRLVQFLPHSPKLYHGSLRLGLTTVSDDVTGEVLERRQGPWPTEDEVRAAAAALEGTYGQTPPVVSARKIEGQRSYRLARRGVLVTPAPTEVHVARFSVAAGSGPDAFTFVAEVSGGTYVRALVRDLGRRLGCGAALAALRRVRIGPLDVAHALAAADPDLGPKIPGALLPLAAMPLVPATVRLEPELIRRFINGLAVAAPLEQPIGACRIIDHDGELVGIGDAACAMIRPRVVLAGCAQTPAPG